MRIRTFEIGCVKRDKSNESEPNMRVCVLGRMLSVSCAFLSFGLSLLTCFKLHKPHICVIAILTHDLYVSGQLLQITNAVGRRTLTFGIGFGYARALSPVHGCDKPEVVINSSRKNPTELSYILRVRPKSDVVCQCR